LVYVNHNGVRLKRGGTSSGDGCVNEVQNNNIRGAWKTLHTSCRVGGRNRKRTQVLTDNKKIHLTDMRPTFRENEAARPSYLADRTTKYKLRAYEFGGIGSERAQLPNWAPEKKKE